MKSSHKTDTHFYFIIQQLTLNKWFKCDCAGGKRKHGFSPVDRPKSEGYFDTRKARPASKFRSLEY